MGTAGYLVSRAAERPEILSLGVTIVAVRFFGIGRPLVRYLERLASHDLALRTLARLRVQVLRADRAARAGRPGGVPARRPAQPSRLGRRRAAEPVPAGLGPPLVAICAGATLDRGLRGDPPVGGACARRAGWSRAASPGPRWPGGLGRSSGSRQAAARGELSAELVEVLRAAPELVVYGHEQEALERVRRADAELARLARRDAVVAGLGEAIDRRRLRG